MSSDPTATTEKAPKPKMGGMKSNTIAWTGGVPKADWSALDETQSTKPYSTYCQRNTDNWNEENKANFRRSTAPKGLQIKSTTTNLYAIKSTLWAHMCKHGLDTIFYVPDPQNNTKVINVIENHSKLDSAYVRTAVAKFQAKWDDYDTANDESARDVLINSLESTFHEHLRSLKLERMSAADVWMAIARSIRSTSTQYFDDLRQKIRTSSPRTVPNQNIMVYCRFLRETIEDLVQANEWQWSLLLNIVQNLVEANNATFQSQQHLHIISVDKMLRSLSSIPADDAEEFVRSKQLHYDDILTSAEDLYKTLLDNGKWEPAKIPKDSGKAPEQTLGNLANMTISDLKALLASASSDKSEEKKKKNDKSSNGKRKCWTCQSTDHIAANCPNKNATTQNENNWRTTPPKDNEKHTKIHKDKIYFWCPRCRQGKGFWTQTHREHGGATLTPEQLKKAKEEFTRTGAVPEVLVAESHYLVNTTSEGIDW